MRYLRLAPRNYEKISVLSPRSVVPFSRRDADRLSDASLVVLEIFPL